MALGRKKLSLMLASTLALGFAAGLAVGQAKAPTADKGLSSDHLRSLTLTEEIGSVKGRPLRMRKVMLLPGGVMALHSHKDLPTVSYLLQGEVTYHQEGKAPVVVRAGDSIAEGKDTTHWAENRAGVAAVWIVVDIPKQP
ncbi:MAG TPA: cupin domain-containing protein [Burkholderiales bacterium]|nr:cupin domain-containing protein [Burkholderiales bacterium]